VKSGWQLILEVLENFNGAKLTLCLWAAFSMDVICLGSLI
jgi:hypothetical protein